MIGNKKIEEAARLDDNFEDLEKFVLKKRPTLKCKDFRIVFLL